MKVGISLHSLIPFHHTNYQDAPKTKPGMMEWNDEGMK